MMHLLCVILPIPQALLSLFMHVQYRLPNMVHMLSLLQNPYSLELCVMRVCVGVCSFCVCVYGYAKCVHVCAYCVCVCLCVHGYAKCMHVCVGVCSFCVCVYGYAKCMHVFVYFVLCMCMCVPLCKVCTSVSIHTRVFVVLATDATFSVCCSEFSDS